MKYLIILIILILPLQIFAMEAPETLDEAKETGKGIMFGLPEAINESWQDAKSVWSRMGDWLYSKTGSWIRATWNRLNITLNKEIEEKTPEVKEEFEREKEEMKKEVPEVSKSLWQRIKDLIN